jgi:CMP-N,N'-diacetyllegionaminic acid synthase
MESAERVLALIPARGGSKGVPRKNVRIVGGRPLIEHTLATALEARRLFHRVIVSTDDDEIADISRRVGAEVPFMRPPELASDTARSIDVVQHATRFVEEQDGIKMDWIMLLQPTDPFRTADDILEALRIARSGNCDSVISLVQVFSVHPMLMKRIENGQIRPWCADEPEGIRRQDYKPDAYMRNGAIYLTRRDVVMEKGSLRGESSCAYVMPPERSVGVDSEIDLALVNLLMQARPVSAVPGEAVS